MVGRDGGRILVVDDNRLNRVKLQHDLHRQGFEVHQAEHGQQALELLRAGAYDVVLLDILMPVLDGYQTLAEMKRDAALRDVPVIVIPRRLSLSIGRCSAYDRSNDAPGIIRVNP